MGVFSLIRKVFKKPVPRMMIEFEPHFYAHGIEFTLDEATFNGVVNQAFPSPQYVLLKMLEEAGEATAIERGFRLSSEQVAALDADHATLLSLPPSFTGGFLTTVSGVTTQPSFTVTISASLSGEEIPIRERTGAILILSATEKFRLTPAELAAFTALDLHQSKFGKAAENDNLTLIGQLQRAKEQGMPIDLQHFESFKVSSESRVGVVANQNDDGSLSLRPSLGANLDQDALEKRWGQLDLSKDSGVMRVDKTIVLLDEERFAAVGHLFENQHIPKEDVATFIETPSAFLDADLVDLELGFSIRVKGIGEMVHVDFGATDNEAMNWFDSYQLTAPPVALYKTLVTPQEFEEFRERYFEAIQNNAGVIRYDGLNIDIHDQKAVEHILQEIEARFEVSDPGTLEEPKEKEDEPTQLTVLLEEANNCNHALLAKAKRAENSDITIDWAQYRRKPYPHQQQGVEWMVKLLHAAVNENPHDLYRLQGALLADDMGLGKTYMSLIAMSEYYQNCTRLQKVEKPILVVAPLSLLENWEDEVAETFDQSPFDDIVVLQSSRDLKRYRMPNRARETRQLVDPEKMDSATTGIKYSLYIGAEHEKRRLDRNRRLVLTTYQTLRDYQFSLCQVDWGMVVFDEAQNIKNPNTLQTRAAKGLKADFKVLVTGTPVENSLRDFWCLMDTAQPGLLGDDKHFRASWVTPILQSDVEERDQVRLKIGQELREAVGPFMLRRTKEEELSGLPQKTIFSGVPEKNYGNVRYSAGLMAMMTGIQKACYEQVIENYKSGYTSDGVEEHALTALLKLRQISLHPRLNEPTIIEEALTSPQTFLQDSAKLQALCTVLDAIRAKNEKVILFMITKKMQLLLKQVLDSIYGLNIAIINGETKAVATSSVGHSETRKGLIKQFEEKSGFNIIIMSPIAAGVGLTVVGANHVVHLERHWNPAKEAQASDRVYRIGQEKPVSIHLPILVHPDFDSFDIHLNRLLQKKVMLKDAVVAQEVVSEGEVLREMFGK